MRLTTIVPYFGNTLSFEDTLAAVLRYASHDCEVIVAHDGRFVDTWQLGDAIRVVESVESNSLAAILNEALDTANGQFVGIVRPGVEWDDCPLKHLTAVTEDTNVASVSGPIQSELSRNATVCSGVRHDFGFNRKLTRGKPLGPPSWFGFYRKSALECLGGFDETIADHYLDLDTALALQNLGFACKLVSDLTATVDRPKRIQRESEQVHGLSAQRAIRRHADESWGLAILSGAKELLCSAVSPSHLVHLGGRLKAGQFRRHDNQFADRVAVACKKRLAQQKLDRLPRAA